ncbi:efflux RND transporter permease subunit [Rhodomicrobium vannielii ATCC 17100]|uniref:efflux RND transporter permease subunit n=1 Tax=Rhodomicrobium vannielii TaxID=1069 RepID=UPI001919064B|nr:efflux RND transporter permease subunit [Rhodomicrobium vannielii]MBJ7535824.1 efflux RND transporter permease subunit [Rhodomicrobium vannielii ATCC 17100]
MEPSNPHASSEHKDDGGFNLSAWAIRHGSLTRFLLVLILATGIYALLHLGQKEDPDFQFRTMVVQVEWPGASVHEMQEQVVDKIETKLQETPQLDYIQSYTHPGSAVVFVNLRGEARGREIPDAFYQVRKKIGDIKQTMPAGVVGPFFNDEFGDTYLALYAIEGKGFTYPELRDFAKTARDILLRVRGVGKVDLLGVQPEKVYIEIPSRVLAERNITVQDIKAALDGQNSQAPAGSVQTSERAVRLDVQGSILTVDEIRELRLRAGTQTVRLGDIAEIKRGLEDPPVARTRHDGNEAVVLGVVMANGFNVVEVGKTLETALAQIYNELPVGVTFTKISDQPAVVTKAIGEFLKALGEALLIVLAVSLFALGWRAGVVVALTIPLVLAATFLAMFIIGIDLQRISLGALIIALGLLVDDAMIAVEMMERKLDEGFDKVRAASFAYTSTAFPMLTGTLITTAGFIPVGFAASTSGEYVNSLFWVVGLSLVISWLAAVYFTPYIGHTMLRHRPVENPEHHDVYDTPIYRRLRAAIAWCILHRKKVVAITVATFILAIVGFAFVPKSFFPGSDRPEILVDLWLPEGSSFAETDAAAKKLEQKLVADSDVATFTAFVGEGAPRFFLPLDQQLRTKNFAQFLVLPKNAEGTVMRDAVIHRMRAVLSAEFPNVRFKVEPLALGPPVGWAIQLRVQGPDRAQVRRIADEVAKTAAANPNVFNVHDNWLELAPTLQLDIDQDRARAIGVTSNAVRQTLQTVLSGSTLTEFREKDQTIGVVLREPDRTRGLLTAVENAYVKTASGVAVPVSQVAKARLVFEPGVEWRRNRLPTITVRGQVPDEVQSVDVVSAIYKELAPLRASLPLGYQIEMQGGIEESGKGQASIAAKVPILVIAILVLLMMQLQSLSHTMLVLVTAPLGIIGASFALVVTQMPFGFVAILGVIALAGIIMRNTVILVDQIQQDLASGIDTYNAIVGSAVRRFRPIMLTATAAVLALVPLAESSFWGPMAAAMMGGILAATALTMTFLPALYALVFRVEVPSGARETECPAQENGAVQPELAKAGQ